MNAPSGASNSAHRPCIAATEPDSCEPHSPLLSKQCRKAQAALEYYLLIVLGIVVLVAVAAWASRLSIAEQAALSNASGLLANGSFVPRDTEAMPSSSGMGPTLELRTFEPYETGRPAFFEIVIHAQYGVSLQTLSVAVFDGSGVEMPTNPRRWSGGDVAVSREYSSQFVPNASGIFTITAVCGNASARQQVIVR